MKSYVDKIKEIQDELKWDQELFESEIHIEIKDDIVTLSGNVVSEEKKRVAESIASKVEGVKSVVNQLQIIKRKKKREGQEEVPSPNSGDPDNSLKVSGA